MLCLAPTPSPSQLAYEHNVSEAPTYGSTHPQAQALILQYLPVIAAVNTLFSTMISKAQLPQLLLGCMVLCVSW